MRVFKILHKRFRLVLKLCVDKGDDEAAAPKPGPALRGLQQEQADIHHYRVHEGKLSSQCVITLIYMIR